MKPYAKDTDLRRLAFLLHDGRWHKAKDLRMDSRLIRACCAEAPDQFISTQKGYRLLRYASDQEVNEAIADLRSRITHLNDRATRLERAAATRGPQRELFNGS